jgi:hypothetical protein
LLRSPPLCLGDPLGASTRRIGTDTKLAPPPSLPSLLFCSGSDKKLKNNTMALVRGRHWHPYRPDTDQPIDFSTGLRSAFAVIKFNFLYRPLLFHSQILKPLNHSQIWVSGVDLFPPAGSRKSLGPKLYRTHQNDIELPSKSTAAPELVRRVMGIASD